MSKRIADMLRAAGRKVTVIDETRDPRVVADEVLRAEQYCPLAGQHDLKLRGPCPQCPFGHASRASAPKGAP